MFAPAILAQRLPEVEPNNTPATAQAITIGTQIDANLLAGEEDWYSFTVAAYTRVRLHTSNTDTCMALLNATGTTYLGIDDDARTTTNGFASEITLNIAASKDGAALKWLVLPRAACSAILATSMMNTIATVQPVARM